MEEIQASQSQQVAETKPTSDETEAKDWTMPRAQPQRLKQKMFAHPFSFTGRIRRKEFIFSVLAYYVITFVDLGIMERSVDFGIVGLFIYLALQWFLCAQAAKRFHDYDESGWKSLFLLVPLYCYYVLWELCSEEGDPDNQYGPDPKWGYE